MAEKECIVTIPLFSIIIPVYNVATYLNECLDSVVSQTISDWEIICVDDGSSDNSGAILDEYAIHDSRFHVIHQSNAGVSAARNVALDLARGEWLTFIDADDIWSNNLLEKLMDAVQKYKADLAICGVIRFGGKGGDIYIGPKTDGMFSPEDIYIKYNSLCSWAWGKIYKKKLWEKIRFPVGVAYSEDRYILHEILYNNSKIPFVAGELYHYRMRNDSATGSEWSPNRLQWRFALEKQVAFFHEKGFIKAEFFTLMLYFNNISSGICKLQGMKPINKDLLKSVRSDFYHIEEKYWEGFAKAAKKECRNLCSSCGAIRTCIDLAHSSNGHVSYIRQLWNILRYDGIHFTLKKIISRIKSKIK